MREPPAGGARMGEDLERAGAPCEERGAWPIFRKNWLPALGLWAAPSLPLSPWLEGGRRGRAVNAIFSPVGHVVSGREIRPKLDGRGMQLLFQGVRLGPRGLLPPPRRSEGSGGSLPFPITDLRGVPPLSPCSREGMEVGEDTRGSLTMLLTLGASLPSPDPSEVGGRGREGCRGDTDLMEVGDKGGLGAVSMGSSAWREEDLLRLA